MIFFSGAEVSNPNPNQSWGHTDKSDNGVGHLNTILACGGGNLDLQVVILSKL